MNVVEIGVAIIGYHQIHLKFTGIKQFFWLCPGERPRPQMGLVTVGFKRSALEPVAGKLQWAKSALYKCKHM